MQMDRNITNRMGEIESHQTTLKKTTEEYNYKQFGVFENKDFQNNRYCTFLWATCVIVFMSNSCPV